ncbi:MAG: hypothetical protein LBO79_08470 [Zoogloeaceae bacterium]|nr:hypothetical protein [Zoogloeaceae bacterium]
MASGQAHKEILGLPGRFALFAGKTPEDKRRSLFGKRLKKSATAFLFPTFQLVACLLDLRGWRKRKAAP